jgi:GIY-YIG catalytic domain
MPIMLNTLLVQAGLSLADVRLLRHQDNRAQKGRSPYELWRDDRGAFDAYQAIQSIRSRVKLRAKYWVSFVGLPDGRSLFAGAYRVNNLGPTKEDKPQVHTEGVDRAGTCDEYELTLEDVLGEFVGKLFIAWGAGARAWIQRPEKKDKVITELVREYKEPDFPGFLSFITSLSKVKAETLPKSWRDILRISRGIYLLTCPKTREQYVGKTSGQDGFWGRWQCHALTGYGDAVKLKSREPSDYQVSILEVVGTAATDGEILEIEERWKQKLRSREMGLNAN